MKAKGTAKSAVYTVCTIPEDLGQIATAASL